VIAKVLKTPPTPLDNIVSLHRSYVIYGLVHHLTITISIMTNGNALWLLIWVHCLPQHNDGKEVGTEHGGVPGVAIEVPKIQ
jgi:hypothetical protein